jgi:hypothetical protein
LTCVGKLYPTPGKRVVSVDSGRIWNGIVSLTECDACEMTLPLTTLLLYSISEFGVKSWVDCAFMMSQVEFLPLRQATVWSLSFVCQCVSRRLPQTILYVNNVVMVFVVFPELIWVSNGPYQWHMVIWPW